MAQSINILDQVKETFECAEKDINGYSPLTLAYIGDDFYDLIIRTVVVERANRPANELHKMTVQYVKAQSQAEMAEALAGAEGVLTEKEADIYRRGRNAKSHTTAKNASVTDYRRATGFEALIGYLYLTGQQERAVMLVKKGLELTNRTI